MTYKYLFQQDELAHLVNLEQQLDLTEKKRCMRLNPIQCSTLQRNARQYTAIHIISFCDTAIHCNAT